MTVIKEFVSAILWINVLGLLFIGVVLLLLLIYAVETVKSFVEWNYALYCFVRECTHGNYDRL